MVPSSIRAGGRAAAELQVTNTSQGVWPGGGANPVYLSYRWLKPDGTVVVRDGNRVGFGGDRWPGETVQVALQVDAPATPGTYTLAFDNYHEGKGYFSELGGVPTSNHTIAVEP